jgi:hypothetical protein
MEKFFNTAGPIKQDLHYFIPMEQRWDLEEVMHLIRQQKYFVLHAPRQTGKTSAMLDLVEVLNREGVYQAVYANLEASQGAKENVARGIRAVVVEIASRLDYFHQSPLLENHISGIFDRVGEDKALSETLTFWAQETKKPVVLILDEVDSLVGDTLISLLRQVRSGYDKRPGQFPHSIILCGVRDVRDYRIRSAKTNEIITGGSAFNIKAESLRLANFSYQNITDLYLQHTAQTGQTWEEGIFDLAWQYTAGQPWLVNALAYEVTHHIRQFRDRSLPITCEAFREARERLILRRDTHLDQLTDKLREDRVRRVIEPMLSTETVEAKHRPDDVQYVSDLGLISIGPGGELTISNDIYREIIPRELTWSFQTMIPERQMWYLRPDGLLDMPKLMRGFQAFFREHSAHWIERFEYKEAGPQLLLQAFLQRIVNGDGRIVREYGLGRGRTDLYIEFGPDFEQKIVIELKIRHSSLENTLTQGLPQTLGYRDTSGAKEAHLVIFDRNPAKTWDEKIWERVEEGVFVWGC